MTSFAMNNKPMRESTAVAADVMPTTRREDAYERVLAAIIYGDLPAGSAVDEKGLAKSFDLGVAGIRDALGRLELEGLVERQPRIGTKIAALGLRELQDVYETRLILEPICAGIAARRADDTDLAKFHAFSEEFTEIAKSRDLRKLLKLDQYFHRSVAAATKNVLLARQVTVLHNNAARFWYANAPRLSDEAFRADLADHMEVLHSIESRNPDAAEKAMRHLLGEFQGFVDFYRTNWLVAK